MCHIITHFAGCYIDIALIIDCSGSIRMTNALGEDNWQYIIDFAVDLVNSINVGDDETHVAAVSFGKQLLVSLYTPWAIKNVPLYSGL